MNFRKIVLAAIVGVLLTPGLALARRGGGDDQSEDENGGHGHIGAQEITQVGLAGAAVLGAVGYLALRRRSQQPKN